MTWEHTGTDLHEGLYVSGGTAANSDSNNDAYVIAYRSDGDIILSIADFWNHESEITITPQEARHLGKLLLKAARLVERAQESPENAP